MFANLSSSCSWLRSSLRRCLFARSGTYILSTVHRVSGLNPSRFRPRGVIYKPPRSHLPPRKHLRNPRHPLLHHPRPPHRLRIPPPRFRLLHPLRHRLRLAQMPNILPRTRIVLELLLILKHPVHHRIQLRLVRDKRPRIDIQLVQILAPLLLARSFMRRHVRARGSDAGSAVGVEEAASGGELAGEDAGRGEALVFAHGHRHEAFVLALPFRTAGRAGGVMGLLAGVELEEAFAEVAPAGGGLLGFPCGEGVVGGRLAGVGLGGDGAEVGWGGFVGGVGEGAGGEDGPGDGEDAFDVGVVEGVGLEGLGDGDVFG